VADEILGGLLYHELTFQYEDGGTVSAQDCGETNGYEYQFPTNEDTYPRSFHCAMISSLGQGGFLESE
jgi:hypothetical protein